MKLYVASVIWYKYYIVQYCIVHKYFGYSTVKLIYCTWNLCYQGSCVTYYMQNQLTLPMQSNHMYNTTHLNMKPTLDNIVQVYSQNLNTGLCIYFHSSSKYEAPGGWTTNPQTTMRHTQTHTHKLTKRDSIGIFTFAEIIISFSLAYCRGISGPNFTQNKTYPYEWCPTFLFPKSINIF